MIVSTDKTNEYVMIEKDEYIIEIKDALAKVSNPISIKNVKKIKDEALEILEKFQCEMSQKEYDGINQLLMSCTVPTPKLLVKDHKPLKESGRYLCQLIVPAEYLISRFSKLGYITIRDTFARNKIEIERFTIK